MLQEGVLINLLTYVLVVSAILKCLIFLEGIVPDMNTAPGLAPPIPPARGIDLEYETEGMVCYSVILLIVN